MTEAKHRIVKCTGPGCEAPIIFLRTSTGKQMPAEAASVEDGDTIFDFKKHKSHFATCPVAGKFRRRVYRDNPKE